MKVAVLEKLFSNAHKHNLFSASPTVLLFDDGEQYDGAEADNRRWDLDCLLAEHPEIQNREISALALGVHLFSPEIHIWVKEAAHEA